MPDSAKATNYRSRSQYRGCLIAGHAKHGNFLQSNLLHSTHAKSVELRPQLGCAKVLCWVFLRDLQDFLEWRDPDSNRGHHEAHIPISEGHSYERQEPAGS